MYGEDSNMSINSLMEAIYCETNHEVNSDHQELQEHSTQQIQQFMESLINYLAQLCMTQVSVDNVSRQLRSWVKEVRNHYRNPKPILQIFMRDFLRLYEQQSSRIGRYGQKKLRYLTQTVSKQIFTEIMRLSCDFKFQNLNRHNYERQTNKRANNLLLITHSLNRIFVKDQQTAFNVLKREFLDVIRKEDKLVGFFEISIAKLNRICGKARNSGIWRAMTMWRVRSLEMKEEETIKLSTMTREFFTKTLAPLTQTWQEEPLNWTSVVSQNLCQVFQNPILASECSQIQFIGLSRNHNNSLDYSAISSYRSNISQLSSASMGEYLLNEEIKFDRGRKFLLIPVIVGEEKLGLVRVCWNQQLPVIIFNRVLMLVEWLKLVLEGFWKISLRLSYYASEYQSNSWHEELYALCLREDAIQLKSLEMVLQAINIRYLEIYHNRSTALACIRYGKQKSSEIPENIYKLIWQKIQTTELFKLDRQGKTYEIMRLQDYGFCRYHLGQEHQSKTGSALKNTIVQCIVGLLTKNFGKIGCQHCKIQVKQLVPTTQYQKLLPTMTDLSCEKSAKKCANVNWKQMLNLKNSQTMQQAQYHIHNIISTTFSNTPVYFKIFYNLNDSESMYIYRSSNKKMQVTKVHKAIAHDNIFLMSKNEGNKGLRDLAKIMQQSPMFPNHEIYLYEKQKSSTMKFIPKKLGRKCLLLLSTYENIEEDTVNGLLEQIGNELQNNTQAFMKCDIYAWAEGVVHDSKPAKYFPNLQQPINYDGDIRNLGVVEFVNKLSQTLPDLVNKIVFKVKGDSIIDLTSIPSQKLIDSNIAQMLCKQSIRSHYPASRAHRILKQSTNLGQKLQQCLTYIPNLSTQTDKLLYASAAQKLIQQQQPGQYTDSRCQELTQFFLKHKKIPKQSQFLTIPIHHNISIAKTNPNICYVVVLLYEKTVDFRQIEYEALVKYMQREVGVFVYKKILDCRIYAVSKLSEFCGIKGDIWGNKCRGIKECLMAFYRQRGFREKQKSALSDAIYGFEEGSRFRFIKYSLTKLKKHSQSIQDANFSGCPLLIAKIKKIFFINPLNSQLQKQKNRKQGVTKLIQTVSSIKNSFQLASRITPKIFFSMINSTSTLNHNISLINRHNSVRKMWKQIQIIRRRNLQEYFRKVIKNQLSFKRSLIILEEEFKLVDPKTVKSATNFLQGRLNLMLNQCYCTPLTLTLKYYAFGCYPEEGAVYVRNSGFGFKVVGDQGSLQLEGLTTVIQPVLHKILPSWQQTYRKTLHTKITILTSLLSTNIKSQLSHIFTITSTNKFQICTSQRSQSHKKIKQQSLQLESIKQNLSQQQNMQRREQHKKSMNEVRHKIIILESQLDKLNVEGKIKSKTNAAYRMVGLLARNQDKQIRNQDQQEGRNQGKNFEKNQGRMARKEARGDFVLESMGLWVACLNGVIKRKQKFNKNYFFALMAHP